MRKGILTLLFPIVLAGCEGGSVLPTVTGTMYDLLVVGNKTVWEDTAGHMMQKAFSAPVPNLPENEENFNVIYLPTSQFDNLVKPARNIFFYEIDSVLYTKASVRYLKDQWARNQAVVRINAPSQQAYMEAFEKNKVQIFRYFSDAEEKRALNYYASYQNYDAAKRAQEMFGIDLLVPGELNKTKEGDKFLWISNGNVDLTKNIVIFSFPYTSQGDFELSHLLAVQDSFTKAGIPCSNDDSYMKNQPNIIPVKEVLKAADSEYCVEYRGMWECDGDLMGGPYVSRSYLTADKRNIVTVMALLYGPGRSKRNPLRMLEASLGSVRVNLVPAEVAKGEK